MNEHSVTAGDGVTGRRLRSMVSAAIALMLALAVATWWFVPWHGRGTGARERVVEVPLNAQPGVRFVGDAACTKCHEEIANSYQRHPMGRSILPIADAPKDMLGDSVDRVLFSNHGLEYSIQNRDGRVIHRETRRDRAGKVVGQVEGEARYVLGSGAHARAFLIQRDDYLFQSPMTWYSQEKRWDIAPSYENRVGRFERQISPACLRCHANAVEHVEGTEGRYRPPIFRGHSIGCERCHGPGELHVAQPTLARGDAPRIVNPARLEPALREAVCQQCHLLGVTDIVHYGRRLEDFRPGLPIQAFETVFVRPLAKKGDHPNADHVEQMYQSRCFRESDGALGCISCHNPHAVPAPETKVAYYRQRCLNCHAEKGCALPSLAREELSVGDSCIDCHMPRVGTSNVEHLATTHHAIVRFRKMAFRSSAPPPEPPPGEPALVPFHRDLMTNAERHAAERDLGVALRWRGKRFAADAQPLLERARAEHPDDVLAWESLGFVLWSLGREDEALREFEAVLEQTPTRESALASAAQLAGRLKQPERAIGLWRRAIAVNPWWSDYHADLAEQLTFRGEWLPAMAAANQALQLSPANSTARKALILAQLNTGASDQAHAGFEALLAFDPPNRDALSRWFEEACNAAKPLASKP